jgi:hypothetical protein
MANTPKAVRTTAKRHAEATRKKDPFGKLGKKTTESTKAWPKMSWDNGIRSAEYVGKFTSKNSEFSKGQSK